MRKIIGYMMLIASLILLSMIVTLIIIRNSRNVYAYFMLALIGALCVFVMAALLIILSYSKIKDPVLLISNILGSLAFVMGCAMLLFGLPALIGGQSPAFLKQMANDSFALILILPYIEIFKLFYKALSKRYRRFEA